MGDKNRPQSNADGEHPIFTETPKNFLKHIPPLSKRGSYIRLKKEKGYFQTARTYIHQSIKLSSGSRGKSGSSPVRCNCLKNGVRRWCRERPLETALTAGATIDKAG